MKVSLLVPTKNRHQFLENILRNFYRQDYPKELMELIIGDDGECLMEKDIPKNDNIKYYKFEDNITLGEKRNRLCSLATGDIIMFFDDDDFYPSCKVSHYVDKLKKSNKIDLVGSSIMYVYFVKQDKILKFGPNGRYHSTCAGIAFKKNFFKKHKFPHVNKAEEKGFLKRFRIPMIQMDPLKSILVIAHNKNTVDKYKMIKKGKETNITLNDFDLTKEDLDFYKNINKEELNDN